MYYTVNRIFDLNEYNDKGFHYAPDFFFHHYDKIKNSQNIFNIIPLLECTIICVE